MKYWCNVFTPYCFPMFAPSLSRPMTSIKLKLVGNDVNLFCSVSAHVCLSNWSYLYHTKRIGGKKTTDIE